MPIRHDSDPKPLMVVMGVSGCGKTEVGRAVAKRLGVPFEDGDDLHPESNVAKMRSGMPLTDDDRRPWLAACAEWLAVHGSTGGVLGCSALKLAYRDRLREGAARLLFVHLAGPQEVVRERMRAREGHFMPMELLASQYDALEPLARHEAGVTLDLDLPVDELVAEAVAAI